MQKSPSRLTPSAIALMVMSVLPANADNSTWQQQVSDLNEAFAEECQKQQTSGAVNLDFTTKLREINDSLAAVLSAHNINIITNNNQERFYETERIFRKGDDADLVSNGYIAERFPTCSRSGRAYKPS